jgi:transposase
MNVYCKLRAQHAECSENEIAEMVSNLTGVSRASVYRLKDEFQKFGKFSTPGKKRPLKVGTQTRLQKYDEFTLNAIRRKVHNFFFRNEIPTALKVMKTINADYNLPNFSVRTVQRILKDLGFIYAKRKRRSILIERDDILQWRRRYLRSIDRVEFFLNNTLSPKVGLLSGSGN